MTLIDILLFRRIQPRKIPTGSELVRINKQIKDFASGSLALIGQRQMMFFSAVILTSFFYDVRTAIFCFLLCEFTELIDYVLSRKILRWDGKKGIKAIQYQRLLLCSSIASALSVGVFVLLTSHIEGQTLHLTPLFFLFSAGLFAAVNNHQIPNVLFVRLGIYGAVFLYIPIYDLWIAQPPFFSVLWLQLLTVVFVLYFVVDCSIIFFKMYNKNLDQLYELMSERDRATDAYEVKSQFVSVISHELRTPLTSIVFALDLLKNGSLDQDEERQANALEIAHKNSGHLASLINDILDLQKLEAGKMDYHFEAIDLNELVKSSVMSIGAMADSVSVEISVLPAAENLIARGDQTKILQVLTNLLSNAIKFSNADGAVEVSIQREEAIARVTIEDHGVGIPECSRDRVFGKFNQVDSSDHRAFSGSGLGLSISEQIIKAHDGIIDYETAVGEGTRFYFELPLIDFVPVTEG
jgi:signal transduction histidine kinase